MGNPVVHFEIIGENQKLLNDFYRGNIRLEDRPPSRMNIRW